MQSLSSWLQTLSAPLLFVVQQLYALTHSYLFALILLALFLRLYKLWIYFVVPGVRFSRRIREDRETLERRRASYTPAQYEELKAHIEAKETSRWRAWLTLFLAGLTSLITFYSVLALCCAVYTAPELVGKPFAWTADITARDPRHVIPIGLGLIGLVNLVVTFRRHRKNPSAPFKPLAQLTATVLVVTATELLLPACVLYYLFLLLADELLPTLLGIALAPFYYVYLKLFR